MIALPIRASAAKADPGDLHAEVRDGALWLPASIAAEASARGLHDAIDLVAYAATFPTALAQPLDWSVPDVMAALKKLTAQLEAHDPGFAQLRTVTGSAFAFGARDPEELSNGGRPSSTPPHR